MTTFLIDENLSPRLVDVAGEFGFAAFHVAHRGWASLADPQLFQRMLDEDLTLVTNNWADFAPMLRRTEIHPGMIVILPNVRRDWQMELFCIALASVCANGHDLVNMVVTVDEAGIIDWTFIPPTFAFMEAQANLPVHLQRILR